MSGLPGQAERARHRREGAVRRQVRLERSSKYYRDIFRVSLAQRIFLNMSNGLSVAFSGPPPGPPGGAIWGDVLLYDAILVIKK